ncbi:hypothetical protein H4Q32_030848 [Labeo rohita]|uniref:ribonuclease H n=1 Tax=Labeo rohita TaxID=84645 RepID=A0ABQ8L5W4_LABRO|nr:hypothetical protein H4Q32_030848 [Labeo rohita]
MNLKSRNSDKTDAMQQNNKTNLEKRSSKRANNTIPIAHLQPPSSLSSPPLHLTRFPQKVPLKVTKNVHILHELHFVNMLNFPFHVWYRYKGLRAIEEPHTVCESLWSFGSKSLTRCCVSLGGQILSSAAVEQAQPVPLSASSSGVNTSLPLQELKLRPETLWERLWRNHALNDMDLLEGMETGDPLSSSLPGRSAARSEGLEARTAATSSRGTGSSLHLSSSEEGDLESTAEEASPQSVQYEELLEVQTIISKKKPSVLPRRPCLHTMSLLQAWVLRTIEKGYAIQFGAPPPPFDGVFPTLVGPKQALVMEQEVETLLRKEAIEVVPPQDKESGFYSRYFIDLHRSSPPQPINLKDAYFHVSILPQHRKFLRFAFRGEAYQYRVLPFGLALSPRTFTKCVDAALVPLCIQGIRILNYIDDWLILAESESLAVRHRDVVLAHMKTLGLRLNAKKSVLSPSQRTTYLGMVWDSTMMQARLSPARIESILAAVKRVKEGRSLTVKQFQQLLGLMAAASNVIPFGLLYMRLLQWWLKTKGFSPRGNPLRMIKVTRRGLRALDMWRKPWFLNQGPALGAPCRRVTLATDASLTGWGAVMSGRSAQGLWMGHHLSWHINCLEMLAVFRALKYFLPDFRDRHVLVRTDSTAVVYYINHQGGQTPLTSSISYTWASECGSRHPVEAGAEARGMDASPRSSEADMGDLWAGPSRSLCHEGECTMSPLVLSSSSSSSRAGCYGTDVAKAASVRLSPDRSAPGSSGESTPGRGQHTVSSPVLAGPSMVLGPDISPRRLSMGDFRQEGSPLTGGGLIPSPPPGDVEAVGVAQLVASGLSTEVVETILQSRAPSTRKLYALKWKLFTSWCGERQQDPANCPIGTVLEFLQARFSTGLAHSTLKVYVAAISAYHAPLAGIPVGKNPLALCKPPCEPIEDIPAQFLTIKTVLLLALTSLKRVGDLQALSVAPSHLEFALGMIKAFLYPRPGYVPKVPTNAPQLVVLQAFCPPPFREPDQQKQNCMCPVRALDAYVQRAALWRKSEQLFVCYGPPKKGFPAFKETLSRWIVDAISTAYESSDLPSSLGVKAHSTRTMGASKAFNAGVPIQNICNAAGWSTPLTFAGIWKSGGVGISFPKRLRMQLEFLKGNASGYVCNHGSPEGTRRCVSVHPSGIPAERSLHPQKRLSRDSASGIEAASHPSMCLKTFLQWVTGQRHVPILSQEKKRFKITVQFNQNCDVKYSEHRICYPTVAACSNTIILPVKHMLHYEDFKMVMLEVFCLGQEFLRI